MRRLAGLTASACTRLTTIMSHMDQPDRVSHPFSDTDTGPLGRKLTGQMSHRLARMGPLPPYGGLLLGEHLLVTSIGTSLPRGEKINSPLKTVAGIRRILSQERVLIDHVFR